MKRSNKLSLKAETVRHLTAKELRSVEGGAYSGDCRMGSGEDGSGSKDPKAAEYNYNYNYNYNYQYGP